MKKYNVYGVGHALADLEYEVAPEQLQAFNIDKGVMTLVDEDRQQEIMGHLQALSCKKSSGGSAANTMVALCQLGGTGFFSCKVADDEIGEFYRDDLLNCGLETNLTQQLATAGITGKCLVLVTPDTDRTMNTFLGISSTFSEAELVPEALAASEYLYMEGYLVSAPNTKAATIKAREVAQKAGVKTALSLSDPNMVQFFKEGLLEIIGSGLDFIFANEVEALKMADTDNLSDAIAHLQTLATGFAITRGPNGSMIFDGTDLLEIAPHPVKAVDTVGAGDMYAGAFLYGLTHNMSYTEAANLASVAAAKVVTQFGPRLAISQTQALLTE
ncbi:MAG: adenosine kinase [Jaaginema sp. PMC 1079.18]|nr:adenosine kinase [Jaaginema sp. PMC 1080.18]MEC4851363.1 adenosine kinase [Jaaginema sp. PMC 1079.18]MEC4865367.1 adenosine kinase [Jaaginema sp. PMC 1078.18]